MLPLPSFKIFVTRGLRGLHKELMRHANLAFQGKTCKSSSAILVLWTREMISH